MEQLGHFLKRIQWTLGGAILLSNIILITLYWLTAEQLALPMWQVWSILGLAAVLTALCIGIVLGGWLLQPIKALWQAVMHVSPSEHGTPAPDASTLKLGRELVTSLASQVYQLANVAEQAGKSD